ncbi:hypothetical protein HYU91_02730 [Candidatus Collierbacteria bacterium]|nr:hypothetical protein [Candidatus Collierbacteria bacterium]
MPLEIETSPTSKTSKLDTEKLTSIAVGGESVIYEAPADYRVPGHPEVPASKVVIKVIKERDPKEEKGYLTEAGLAFLWLRLSPPLVLTTQFREEHQDFPDTVVNLAALVEIFRSLYPTKTEEIEEFYLGLTAAYGETEARKYNLVRKINDSAANSHFVVRGQPVAIPQVFPHIYEFGISKDYKFFMAMQRVDVVLVDTLHRRGPLNLAKFNSYPEAEKALHIQELAAQLSLLHQEGYINGDLRVEDLGLVAGKLVQLDPSLNPIGRRIFSFAPSRLPPEMRVKLPEPPIASPAVDHYQLSQILKQTVSLGV